MSLSIIRGKHVITRALDRHRWEQIDDGAVVQQAGVITAIGTFAALRRDHPDAPVIGTGEQVLLPGFVNGHHHVGLTPVQLGSPDMPLELWFATRLVSRDLDLYLDTLYSAFEMIASGITTVQHIHGWMPGKLPQVEERSESVIRAYEDIGMRVSYCFALRDQNHLVYEANADFLQRVPDDVRPLLAKHGVPSHMHLVETAYQKEYAKRRGGGTAVDYIGRYGLLGPKMTLGHGVWLSEGDLDKIAETGTNICHNCSSNFRLRSGVAPLNRFEAKGINIAIGLDEAGINDDRDMLQEMRMVLRAHREPGMDDRVPTMAQVFRMATVGGAKTTPFGTRIGSLEIGKAADMVLLDWQQISYPYLDAEMPVLDAVIQRAKTEGVKAVMAAGEIIYQDGTFTKVDRDAALRQLSDLLKRPLSSEELERRQLSKAILPHVKAFYEGYHDENSHVPYYKQSSRV